MGSIIDYVECTQCGGVYYTDFNYKTGHEFGICHSCGMSHKVCLFETEDEKCEPEVKSGFGVYMIQDIEGYRKLTIFYAAPSTEEINKMLSTLNGVCVDIESSYLCVWNADKKQLDNIFGVSPKYADEFYIHAENSESLCNSNFDDEELPF